VRAIVARTSLARGQLRCPLRHPASAVERSRSANATVLAPAASAI